VSQLRPRHDIGPLEIEQLEERLYEHNVAATGHADGRGLGFEALDGDGRQIAAVAGHTWGGVAELAQVWVDPAHRGRGLGRALVEAAIAEARARGCRSVFLMTYDFQAPGLYAALGFERVVEVEGWPLGHTHILMRLSLVTAGDQT
jgi:GNAT superfamily N-acetyltransferase